MPFSPMEPFLSFFYVGFGEADLVAAEEEEAVVTIHESGLGPDIITVIVVIGILEQLKEEMAAIFVEVGRKTAHRLDGQQLRK